MAWTGLAQLAHQADAHILMQGVLGLEAAFERGDILCVILHGAAADYPRRTIVLIVGAAVFRRAAVVVPVTVAVHSATLPAVS